MSGNLLENEIWKLVEPTDVCIKESTAKESHFRAKTVDECARKCSKATDLFAFGTNEFGGQGCHYGLCKCDCIYKKDDSDHNCQDLDKQSYWFFQMKRGVNFGREGRKLLILKSISMKIILSIKLLIN